MYNMLLALAAATALTSLALSVLSYWAYWRWSHRAALALSRRLPGPPGYPLVGNALVFMARPEKMLDIFEELVVKYGDYVRFWLGPELNVMVRNPADIRLLLSSHKINKKGDNYKFLETYIGPGILTGGPTWRHHRKIATPSYNKRSVQLFSRVFNAEAAALVQTLRRRDPTQTFNVYEDVIHTTTQSVCQTLMGLSKEDSQNVYRMDEVVRHTPMMYSEIFLCITRWWYQIPLVYWLIGGPKRRKYFTTVIQDMTKDIVAKRRKALQELPAGDADAMGVVDRFILSGDMTEQEIIWETFTLFTTSQEASAKIASGVLLFLAHLPEWQDRVYTEILEVVGAEGELTEEQVKRLVCLDAVYREVLRYLAIGALLQRTVEEDVAIDNGRIVLPAGTALVLPLHLLHRDPRYWPRAAEVLPERFMPSAERHDPNAFVPFSLGPMDCLGRVYATAMIKMIVVQALRQLVFEADGRLEDLELHVAISVKFAKGYNLRVRPRHRDTQR